MCAFLTWPIAVTSSGDGNSELVIKLVHTGEGRPLIHPPT